MNILRLSALSLTIVLFTLGGLILPESTTLAHHCKGGHWTPACDDPAPPSSGDATYSVIISGSGGVMAQSVTPWSEGGKRNSIDGSVPDEDFFTNLGVIVNGGPDSFTQAQGAWGEGADEPMLRRELAQEVRDHIDELPENLRTPLLLRDIEGLSHREVARALKLTENAAKLKVHRARQALRALLQPRMGQSS